MNDKPFDSHSLRKHCRRIHRRWAESLEDAFPDLSSEARHARCLDDLGRSLFLAQLETLLRGNEGRDEDLAHFCRNSLPPELDFVDEENDRLLTGNGERLSLPRAALSSLKEELERLCRRSLPEKNESPARSFFLLGAVANECWRGKIFARTAGGRPTLRERSGHRKQHGAFYTPEVVVRYMIDRAMADAGEAAQAGKILDPACGGGIFLLEMLLREMERIHERSGHAEDFQTVLRIEAELKRLHGMDLDRSAVVTTRRNLLLAAIWGVRTRQSRLEVERFLAWCRILQQNIVARDALADSPDQRRAPPFEPASFSIIVGNPPYRKERSARELLEPLSETSLGTAFRTARMDLWYYFVHASLQWLAPGGRLVFIVGAYWLRSTGARCLIDALARETIIEEIFLLGDLPLFEQVQGRHLILALRKKSPKSPPIESTRIRRVIPEPGWGLADHIRHGRGVETFRQPISRLFGAHGLNVEKSDIRLSSMEENTVPLEELGSIRQGIVENPARVSGKAANNHPQWHAGEGVFVLNEKDLRRLEERTPLSPEERSLLKPYLQASDCVPFSMIRRPRRYLIYSTESTWPDFEMFPALGGHLQRFRPLMEARRETRRGRRRWWHLHWPRDPAIWETPRLVIVQMARRPTAVPLFEPIYVPFHCHVFLPHAETTERLEYFAALLNSRLMHRWLDHHAKHRGVGLDLTGNLLRRVPIRRIDFRNTGERAKHDELVAHARRLLSLLPRTRWEDSSNLEYEIQQRRNDIDTLVLELYEINPTSRGH